MPQDPACYWLRTDVPGRYIGWLDTGTHASLLEAGDFIQTNEQRQGLKVACPEIALRLRYIDGGEQLKALAPVIAKSNYGLYLLRLMEEAVY